MTVLWGCGRADPQWRPTDRVLIDKAIRAYSNGKASKEEVLKEVTPVVVYLPKMTCVGMNLNPGWAGGDTTICYDDDGKQVLFYVNGD
jgi:hypothetical protein